MGLYQDLCETSPLALYVCIHTHMRDRTYTAFWASPIRHNQASLSLHLIPAQTLAVAGYSASSGLYKHFIYRTSCDWTETRGLNWAGDCELDDLQGSPHRIGDRRAYNVLLDGFYILVFSDCNPFAQLLLSDLQSFLDRTGPCFLRVRVATSRSEPVVVQGAGLV